MSRSTIITVSLGNVKLEYFEGSGTLGTYLGLTKNKPITLTGRAAYAKLFGEDRAALTYSCADDGIFALGTDHYPHREFGIAPRLPLWIQSAITALVAGVDEHEYDHISLKMAMYD